MGATLSHFAFLVEGHLDGRGFYRHVEVVASSLGEAKMLATQAVCEDGGAVSGFDEVEDRGTASSIIPALISATGYVLFPPGES